ncbi:MAG: hypothetical protein JWQ35_794 [Bacteriovoracaceae bacterium]|nr:hypothetical protein [Bacteriovoracaceae bacterium]
MTHQGGIVEGNLHQFFNSLLVEAAEQHRVKISPTATQYVTDLLVAFQDSAKLFAQDGVRIPVLADMLLEAMDADHRRRITILRQMGDTSLMVSGFYPEALSKRSIDLSYYQQMGEIAYHHLSSITTELNVFDELSERFIKLSSLLNEISEQLHAKNYSVTKLMEFYTNSGSQHILEQLKKQGVIPLPRKKTESFD